MNWLWITIVAFILGLFIGTNLGILLICVLVLASKPASKETE